VAVILPAVKARFSKMLTVPKGVMFRPPMGKQAPRADFPGDGLAHCSHHSLNPGVVSGNHRGPLGYLNNLGGVDGVNDLGVLGSGGVYT
jgi:hypothetical protein